MVRSGSTVEADFIRHRRPKVIELTFPGTEREPVRLTLTDVSEPQALTLDVRDVRLIVFRVVETFPSAAGGDDLLAIREIEVKQRQLEALPTPGLPLPTGGVALPTTP